MSKVAIQGDASGTGTFTIASPNSNSNYTLTLPAETGTIVTSATTSGISASALTTGTIPKARMYAGAVLQVVQTVKTDTFSSSSASYVDITGLSLSITPSSASSRILLVAAVSAIEGATNSLYLRYVRNSTAIGVGDAAGSRIPATSGIRYPTSDTGGIGSLTMVFVDSPADTSAITYKIQIGLQGGTGYVNRSPDDTNTAGRGRYVSTITAMEIAG